MYDVEVPGLFPDDDFDGNFITNGDVFACEEISVLFVSKKESGGEQETDTEKKTGTEDASGKPRQDQQRRSPHWRRKRQSLVLGSRRSRICDDKQCVSHEKLFPNQEKNRKDLKI